MKGFACRFAVWMCLFSGLSVFAVAHADVVVIGAEDSWEPFAGPDGKGLTNSIVQEAYATQGVEVQFYVAPYVRLLKDVEHGDLVGLFNVTKEPSTIDRYRFGDQKLFTATTAYYHHQDRPLKARNLREVADGMKVGMIIGYEYGPYILANHRIQPVRLSKQENLVKMLLSGRLDTIIMFDAIARQTLPKVDRDHKIERAFDGEHSDIYVAFSRRHPDGEKYMKILDAGLKEMRSNGRLEELLDGQAKP